MLAPLWETKAGKMPTLLSILPMPLDSFRVQPAMISRFLSSAFHRIEYQTDRTG